MDGIATGLAARTTGSVDAPTSIAPRPGDDLGAAAAGPSPWRPSVRLVLAVLVLIPLLATAVLAASSARSAWKSRHHAQIVAHDAHELQAVALARAEMNRLELPLAAISYARQLGITEPELDAVLHPSVPFIDQVAQQITALRRYPTFSTNPVLRSDVATLPYIVLNIAEGSATFDEVNDFLSTMAADVDKVWYADYNDLQAQVGVWSPPGSFELHVATLRQAYQAFLAGGQEIGNAVFVLEGIGPANSKEELVQGAGEYSAATAQFKGQLSPRAHKAWRYLQTNPEDLNFAATVQEAVAVAIDGGRSPFAGNLTAAGAAAAPGLQYLTDLNRLVTAASVDLRTTAIGQANNATGKFVSETSLLLLLSLICVGSVGLTGRVLTRPLKRLARSAKRVHSGDFDLPLLPEIGPREVVTTTAAFNDMVLTLKAVEAKAVALGSENLSDPELLIPLPGRTGLALQASIDALSLRIREREIQRQLLHDAATHDGLTGLLNRPAVLEFLNNDVARRRHAGETVAVLFIDLDGLKPLNDTYGHEAGDAAILATALALSHATSNCDVVGRLGGDEFLVVLCHIHSCEADAVVRRIRQSVSDCRIPVTGQMVPLEASVGIALAQCDQDTDPMMLVRQADEAMYSAKKASRARKERIALGT